MEAYYKNSRVITFEHKRAQRLLLRFVNCELREKIMSSKINLKTVRSFSIGFMIHSPTLNGLYIELHFAWWHLAIWSRGKQWFGYNNYWNG